jgi:hypothetical protein
MGRMVIYTSDFPDDLDIKLHIIGELMHGIHSIQQIKAEKFPKSNTPTMNISWGI